MFPKSERIISDECFATGLVLDIMGVVNGSLVGVATTMMAALWAM